jgi:hypothetical protein
MEFKGSKGIWTIEESVDIKWNQPVLNINAYDVGQKSIVTIWSGLDLDDPIDDEIKANALLISKAPEMLGVLKECLDTFTCSDQSDRELKSRIEQLIKSTTTI